MEEKTNISMAVMQSMAMVGCFGLCSCWNWAKDQRTLAWKAVRDERLAWKVAVERSRRNKAKKTVLKKIWRLPKKIEDA